MSGKTAEAGQLPDGVAPKISPFYAACVVCSIRDKDRALKYLDQGVTERDILVPSMGVNPYLDRLHSDSRFIALERRVGLEPAQQKRYPSTEAMRITRLLLLATLAVLAFQAGCIGRQPSQQGTWSKQDSFKTKITDGRKHSPANPE